MYLKVEQFFKNNIKQLLILALLSVTFSQPWVGVTGYLRETEASFCMDECSQYYIEHEVQDGPPLAWISFPNIFDKSVLIAIAKWKFNPDMVDGQPVEKRARQDIKFTLKK